MTVLRCTAKLLRRLHQPAKPPEPEPQANPLGEWYADFDDGGKQRFVVMLNPATGAVLWIPATAEAMRSLNAIAVLMFTALCIKHEMTGPGMKAEALGFADGFAYGPTRDRSVLSSLTQRKMECAAALDDGLSALGAADFAWKGLYKHPSLGRDKRDGSDYHRPLDLLRKRLVPDASNVLPFRARRTQGPEGQAI